METHTIDKREHSKKAWLVVRLFRGEIPLIITYWVFGIIIGNYGFYFIYRILIMHASNPTIISVLIIHLIYNVFIFIAIWRSAGKYEGRPIWSALARITVVLGLISMLINTIYFSAKDEMKVAEETVMEAQRIEMINRDLPINLDSNIRLDRVSVDFGNIFFDYTLTNLELNMSNFSSKMKTNIQSIQCDSKDIRKLLSKGKAAYHIIYDYMKKEIDRIELGYVDCEHHDLLKPNSNYDLRRVFVE